MKIAAAEVIITSPGRNFVTLKIVTDDGVVGYGDGTLNGRELAVASYLRDHVAPLLIGRDPHRIEDTWQYLYRGAYWRRGPVTMAAIAAVDVALWDIKAKVANLPLYQLLGGASRTAIRTYGHASGRDIPELLDSVREHREAGFTAIRVQCGVPGLDRMYAVSRSAAGAASPSDPSPSDLSRPQVTRPEVEEWDTAAYLRFLPKVFAAVREEFGEALPLLHDAHHRLTPIEAARLGKSLEPFDLFWLEDVTPAENQEGLRLVRGHTVTPLAIGEVFNTVWDYQTLIREQLIDYVRSSVTHAGGVTALRRIFDFAAQYQIKAAIHGPVDISPVGMAAGLHLDLAIHNFGIQEFAPHRRETLDVFQVGYRFADGYLHPGEAPGIGVTVDEQAAAAYPYAPAYLPVNTLLDGTVHDW
jgi:mannonate dehydratase